MPMDPSGLYRVTPGPPADSRAPLYLTRHQSRTVADSLLTTANALVDSAHRKRGIYATDDDHRKFNEYLDGMGGEKVLGTHAKMERRKRFRECMLRAVDPEHISGILLYPEDLFDHDIVEAVKGKGIHLGVRAHTEEFPFPSSPNEYISAGMDNLIELLRNSKEKGATFAKFRGSIACSSHELGLPSQNAMEVQADVLGRFASVCQHHGLVPLLEVDIDASNDASLERSVDVHQKVLTSVFSRCVAHGVLVEGLLIQPSFPQIGVQHVSPTDNRSAHMLALATCTLLSRSLPVAIAGVVFTTSKTAPTTALDYLREVNRKVRDSKAPSSFGRLPPLSFAFRIPLQNEAMKFWVEGDDEKAQQSFKYWCKAASLALDGGDLPKGP